MRPIQPENPQLTLWPQGKRRLFARLAAEDFGQLVNHHTAARRTPSVTTRSVMTRSFIARSSAGGRARSGMSARYDDSSIGSSVAASASLGLRKTSSPT